MSMKKFALVALASTMLASPAFASDIDQLMKEINALKAKVNELQKKSAAAPASVSAAPVVNSVKACEAHGDGFFVIPGTSTCLRISGYGRADVGYNELVQGNDVGGKTPLVYGGRIRLNTDARSSTEFGVVRGFTRINLDVDGTGSNSLSNGSGNAKITADYAYASVGGFSGGIQDSAFLFYNRADNILITGDSNAHPIALSYTLPIAAGFSATISMEDPWYFSQSASSGNKTGAPNRPDFVGALNMTQGALAMKLSGSTHQNRAYDGSTAQGYAGQLGMKYTVSPETAVTLQGTYAKGAMKYLGYGANSGDSYAGSIADGLKASYDYSNTTNIDESDLTSGWSLLGALKQKIGSGNLNIIGQYGVIDSKNGIEKGNDFGAQSAPDTYTIKQAEMNYDYVLSGFHIQPGIAYISAANEKTNTSDKPDFNQWRTLLRVQRDF